MKKSFKTTILLVTIALVVVYLISTLLSIRLYSKELAIQASKDQISKKQASNDDPCWFLVPEGAEASEERFSAYKNRMDRETYGYPQDTPLSDAVKTFNQEAKCNYTGRSQPLLTEEEVITAAIDGVVHAFPENNKITKGDKSLFARKKALEKISIEKLMPKGSLLADDSGYQQLDKNNKERYIHVRYWKIYLYLSLDKNPREANLLKPEQVCLIRQNYIKAEYEYREK